MSAYEKNNIISSKESDSVNKTIKKCNEYGKNYFETGISTTPDFSSFGIASNTPGVDLAEAKMFDTKDDF